MTSSNTTGGWTEIAAPGVAIRLNPATMPHALLSEADGSFTFKRLAWDDRAAGDDKSAPVPSFTGKRMNDVFFAHNRLGFLSGENVVLSRAGGEFYNFFREKAAQVLDTDPIDVASTERDIAYLSSAVPFDEDIIMFHPKGQLRLTSGQETFTPSSVEMKPAAHYESYDSVTPVGSGASVVFAVDRGEFSGVMEGTMEGTKFVASETTEHVPRYVPRGLTKLAVCTTERLIFGLSALQPHSLSVYSYFTNSEGRVQSSWSRWTWPDSDTILDIGVFASDMVMLIQRADGLYLETMSLASGRVDADADYITYLDRRVDGASCVRVYSIGSDTTAVTLPYPTVASDLPALQVWTKVPAGSTELPRRLHHVMRGDSTLVLTGDQTASGLFIGLDYLSTLEFSEQFLRQDGASRADGRLQLRRFQTVHGGTGGYVSEVLNNERNLTETTSLGEMSASAWAALLGFNADATVSTGVSFTLDPASAGSYDQNYSGPITGGVVGIPADGRYEIGLAGSLDDGFALRVPISSGLTFAFPSSGLGVKTLSVIRVADGKVIHAQTFETGGAAFGLSVGGGSLLVDGDGGLTVSFDLGLAGMLRGFAATGQSFEDSKSYAQAQSLALYAAVTRGDEATATAWLRGLARLGQIDGFPTVSTRPAGLPLTTDRFTDVSAWALLASARFLAEYPASTSAAVARSIATSTATLVRSRISVGLLPHSPLGVPCARSTILGYFALKMAAGALGDASLSVSADGLSSALMNFMWVSAEGRFKETTVDSMATLELHALGTLFLAATGRTELAKLSVQWVEYYRSSSGASGGYARTVPGLDKQGSYVGTSPPSWSDGSLLVTLAKSATGDRAGARMAYREIAPLFKAAGVSNPIAPDTALVVPWVSSASTALAVLAESPQGFLGVVSPALGADGPISLSLNKPHSYRTLEDRPAGSGSAEWPIDMKSTTARIRLRSLGALAFGFLSASWEGFFTARARKV
ncbi:hypothetical protein [Phenylobacterium sp.]|uniref:phage nozzle protein n=1 Tax=Phenylobacterium sp. TaxID=1871053 RepID=UPI002737955B|nr:hypothetical protein [Phenylobacterium sp.]MDP3869928.1 hypothetical protein [Phenylobacterium sp.]